MIKHLQTSKVLGIDPNLSPIVNAFGHQLCTPDETDPFLLWALDPLIGKTNISFLPMRFYSYPGYTALENAPCTL